MRRSSANAGTVLQRKSHLKWHTANPAASLVSQPLSNGYPTTHRNALQPACATAQRPRQLGDDCFHISKVLVVGMACASLDPNRAFGPVSKSNFALYLSPTLPNTIAFGAELYFIRTV
jgi:hypothetical protein